MNIFITYICITAPAKLIGETKVFPGLRLLHFKQMQQKVTPRVLVNRSNNCNIDLITQLLSNKPPYLPDNKSLWQKFSLLLSNTVMGVSHHCTALLCLLYRETEAIFRNALLDFFFTIL